MLRCPLFLRKRDFDNYRTNRNKPSDSVGKEVRVLFINAERKPFTVGYFETSG